MSHQSTRPTGARGAATASLDDRDYLRQMAEASVDGLAVVDRAGAIADANAALARLTGAPRETLLGRALATWFDGPEELEAVLAQAFADRPVADADLTLRGDDGERRLVSCNASGLAGSDGDVAGVLVVLRDITARRTADRERARLAAIVEASTDAIIGVTPDTRIASWNDGATRLYGWTAQEAIGRSVVDLLATDPDRRRAELYEIAGDERLLAPGDMRDMRKDGTVVDVSISASPIRDERGELIGFARIARDVSDRKAAELRAAELAAIVDASADAILSASREATILTWNAGCERMYGWTAEEAIGQNAFDLLALEPDVRRRRLPEIVAGGLLAPIDVQDVRKDGTVIDVSMTTSAIRDAAGEIVAITRIARDISDRKAAELQRARLAAIIEASSEAIASMDRDARILTWNAGAEQMYGWTAEEAVGRDLFDLLARDPDARRSRMPAILAGGTLPAREVQDVHKDGRVIDVAMTTSAIRDAGGRVVAIARIARDITESKAAELQRARLAAIVEASSDAILGLSPEAVIETWSAGAERMYGYTAEEAVGRDAIDLLAHDPADFRARTAADLREGRVIPTLETRDVRKDGTVIDVSISSSPILDERGRMVGIAAIARDVTERNQAAAELERARDAQHEMEQLVAEGFASSPVGMVMIGMDHRYVQVNAAYARILGFDDPEDVVGLDAVRFTHPDDLEMQGRAFRALVDDDVPFATEGRVVRRDGSVAYVRSVMTLVRGRDGRPVGYHGQVEDVTERRRAQEALRRLTAELEQRVADRTRELQAANHELEAFTYSVSHDLRAPLRAIDGFSLEVARRYGDELDQTGQDLLGRVRAAAGRMGDLIDALLALSRLSRRELVRRPVDLSAIAREIEGELRRREPDREVELAIEDGVTAVGDPDLLRTVLQNLLSNAWKFTARTDGARIELARSPGDGGQAFVVRDNGAGFDMAYAEQLFRPFERLHRQDEFPGVGVGLTTVQRIVHRHGGSIRGEGAVGAGAAFHIILPLAEGPAA